MPTILDACAVIAFLRGEEGAEVVQHALLRNDCMIHALNLCEVYKDCLVRGEDKAIADAMLHDLRVIGLTVRQDMDEDIWKDAATTKAQFRRIALADCYAVALTRRTHGTLFTSDHAELTAIQSHNVCRVRFIR